VQVGRKQQGHKWLVSQQRKFMAQVRSVMVQKIQVQSVQARHMRRMLPGTPSPAHL
jgi:hypothetical protein